MKLECSLFDYEHMSDREYLERIIHNEFTELGKSGSVYDKAEVIEYLLSLDGDRQIEIEDFVIMQRDDNKIDAHYVTNELDTDTRAFRHSRWTCEDGVWKLYYHSGKIIE